MCWEYFHGEFEVQETSKGSENKVQIMFVILVT